jgi:hypothetical protein
MDSRQVQILPHGVLPGVDNEPEALIKEARRRQRRRWLAVAVAVVVTSAAGAAAVLTRSGAGNGTARAHSPSPRPEAPVGAPALLTVSTTRLPRGSSFSLAAGFHAVWVTGIGVTYEISQTTGRIVRTISTPGTFPGGCTGIAAGAGAVWVTHGCRGVYRIDPRSGRVIASLRVPDAGNSIAVAAGLVWLTDNRPAPSASSTSAHYCCGELLRIQPRTDRVVGKPIPVGDGDWTLTQGAGALWVTSYGGGGPGPVTRIDLATGTARRFGDLNYIQAVGAGSLWTSDVRRVDPVTGKSIASIRLPTQAVVKFWKGSAWALIQVPRSIKVLRIDPATNRVTGKPALVGKPLPARLSTDPTTMTAGPTGLWVLDYGRSLLFHLALRPAGR